MFAEADCDFPPDKVPANLTMGYDLTCGSVTVPQDHDDPEGDSIDIFVIRITTPGTESSATPLFLLAGGPGQAGSDILGAFSDKTWGSYASWTPLLMDRDTYLIDQRGTGRTEPAVVCPADRIDPLPAVDQLEIAAPVDDEARAATADYYGDCADALLDEGIDLATYNNRQSAADLDLVRQAIGAERVDLIGVSFGVSYGSWLALEMMRYHPDSIRGVVLNSPLPPQADLFQSAMMGFQNALDGVFAGCADDPQCDAAYPDLERTFQSTIGKLDAEPMMLTYEDPTSGEQVESSATGQDLLSLVFNLFYSGPVISLIPPLIGSVAEGDGEIFSQLVPIMLSSEDGIGTALHFAVNCQDEIPFLDIDEILTEAEQTGISQYVIDDEQASAESYTELCAAWDLAPSAVVESAPVVSTIPTLIVTGKFDPITPTVNGEMALETLSNGMLVESPIAGHDPLSTSGTCGIDIVQAFLNHPRAEVNASCLDDLGIDFSPT